MRASLFIIFFVIGSLDASPQMSLSTLTKYIRMDYDDLDEKLTGQGYKFNSKSGVVLDSFHSYVWSKDNTKSAISILVQRDTISTYSEGNNLGYADVNKYAINYFTLNPDFYTNILNEVKK